MLARVSGQVPREHPASTRATRRSGSVSMPASPAVRSRIVWSSSSAAAAWPVPAGPRRPRSRKAQHGLNVGRGGGRRDCRRLLIHGEVPCLPCLVPAVVAGAESPAGQHGVELRDIESLPGDGHRESFVVVWGRGSSNCQRRAGSGHAASWAAYVENASTARITSRCRSAHVPVRHADHRLLADDHEAETLIEADVLGLVGLEVAPPLRLGRAGRSARA